MDDLNAAAQVRQGETIPPAFKLKAFHCVFCMVYVQHTWRNLNEPTQSHLAVRSSLIWVARCTNCNLESYWRADRYDEAESLMLFPLRAQIAPAPHADLPADVREDYEEAASIVDRSPRGASALLRLALQKLMPHLGENGENLNTDIASLVLKGLDPQIQQALDALRVIGNNAVHPGELDLRDDVQTAAALFGLINYIVEQRISHPRKLQQLYDGLPAAARAAIAARDQ
jgi:hypothetical protein